LTEIGTRSYVKPWVFLPLVGRVTEPRLGPCPSILAGYLVDPDEAERIARQILSELDALDRVLTNQEEQEPVRYNEATRTVQQMAEVQIGHLEDARHG
jgi:hypothetical protein